MITRVKKVSGQDYHKVRKIIEDVLKDTFHSQPSFRKSGDEFTILYTCDDKTEGKINRRIKKLRS